MTISSMLLPDGRASKLGEGIWRATFNTPAVLSARSVNALYLREAGRFDEAAADLLEACSACLRNLSGERLQMAPWLLEVTAGLLAEGFDVALAATLLAAADASREASGTPRPWFDDEENARMRRVIAAKVDAEARRCAESAGRELSTEEALRRAVTGLRPGRAAPARRPRRSPWRRRRRR